VAGSSLLAEIHERSGGYGPALHILAVLALASAILPLAIRPPSSRSTNTAQMCPAATAVPADKV